MTVLAPNNLTPTSGQSVPTFSANTFTWQSENQYSYYIEWSRNISGATLYNSGWITSSIGSYEFPTNSFVNTFEYKWHVKIRNSSGLESNYSDWSLFRGGNNVELEITFPENEYDQITSLPTYTHSFTPLNNAEQRSFQYQVYTNLLTWDEWSNLTSTQQDTLTNDELELLNSTEVWDSGEVISTATSVEQPAGCFISGNYWYRVKCTIKDSLGNTYVSPMRTFYILLDSIPQTPIITATSDPTNGRNIISITNPTPDAGQVSASYNKLYRKKLDGSWELLTTNITTATAYDPTCRSDVEEEYSVSAVGTNAIEGGKSTSATATCLLDSWWFTNLTTNTTIEMYANVKFGQMASERGRIEVQGMDETYPQVLYSPQRFYRGNFQATILKPIGKSWPTYINQVCAILNEGNQILMRSPYGDTFQFDIYDLQITPDKTGQYRDISFSMVEVVETVPVGTYTYDTPDTTYDSYWIIDPETYTGQEIYGNAEWGTMMFERDRFESIGLDGEMPSVSYGNKKATRSGFSGLIIESATTVLAEDLIKLRELIDPKIKKPLIFRTPDLDYFYIDAYSFTFEIINTIPQARKISFEFIELSKIILPTSEDTPIDDVDIIPASYYFFMPSMVVKGGI